MDESPETLGLRGTAARDLLSIFLQTQSVLLGGVAQAYVVLLLIADDSEQRRAALSELLSKEEGWEVCGAATNGRQAVLLASQCKPDLIILDFAMPMLNGLEAGLEIMKLAAAPPMILYTLHKNEQIDLEAKRMGFKKVISKTDGPQILVESVRELLRAPVSPLAMIGIENQVALHILEPTQMIGGAAGVADRKTGS